MNARKLKSRGAAHNPPNRFEPIEIEWEPDADDPEAPAPGTVFLRDAARSLIACNDSPDVGCDASINPYRGCEHGCIYCYARPTHEYMGLSAGLDFETKIFVKESAPQLLRKELAAGTWTPQTVAISGVTDPYQPVERKLRLTRRCLEVFLEFRNPVGIVTKNRLVTRDSDLLAELARFDCAAVFLSVTTLDKRLQRKLEPRAAVPAARLETIRALAEAGVPVGALIAPVIPGLTDHELPKIVQAVADAGARFAGYIVLRLPFAVKDLFENWLERHYPTKKNKVLNRVREMRGGELNDPHFCSRMKGEGIYAGQIEQMFRVACRKAGIEESPRLSTGHFRHPAGRQLSLF
jgi:DNA repair photolyase